MKTIIIIALSIINLYAIFMIFRVQNNKEIQTKIITTVVLVIVTYIIVKVIYGIASIGVDEVIVNQSRNLVEFTFLPINIIAVDFPLMIILNKEGDKLRNKKLIILAIWALIVIAMECSFIKSIDLGISHMQDQIRSNVVNG